MIHKEVHLALESLGITEYVIRGVPSNEAEFHQHFRKVTGEDDNGSAIESADPSDFGVTWTEIQTTMDELAAIKVATAYREARRNAYSPVGDQLDVIWKWLEAEGLVPDTSNSRDLNTAAGMLGEVKAVKAAYPKGD